MRLRQSALFLAFFLVPPLARALYPKLLATDTVLLLERPISAVRFCGGGRHKFLHGLCTANVENIARGSGVLDASVVDKRGHTTNLLTLIDTDEAILALGPAGRGEQQRAFFDKYAFPADDVTIVRHLYATLLLIHARLQL